MAAPVLTHRCWNHVERVAVARCISCGRHYCRECVTEHAGRMTCAACLRREEKVETQRYPWLRWLWRTVHTGVAVIVVWWLFLIAGQALVRMPSSFHEGTLWRGTWWEESEGGQ